MINKKTLILILKACISLSLLTFLLLNIDWTTVSNNLKNANILLVIFVLMLNIIERFQLTYKWNLLLKARNMTVSFFRLFLINSIGGFLGLFLPSSLGTDVVRGYYLVKNNSEKSISISSVFVDRILGLISLLLLGVVSILFAGDLISKFNLKLYLIVFSLLTLLSLYLFQRKETVRVLNYVSQKTNYNKIIDFGVKLHSSILDYKKYPKTLLYGFFITILVQVTRVLQYYFLALAFNIQIPIVYYFLFIPVIMIIIMIPISIGGLGLREGTFVAFFTIVGMSVNDAIIITFTKTFLDTLDALIFGGGGYLFYRAPLKEQIELAKSQEIIKSNE